MCLAGIRARHSGNLNYILAKGRLRKSQRGDNKHTLPPNGKEKQMRQHDAEATAYSSSPDRTSGGRKHVVCAPANQSDRPNH